MNVGDLNQAYSDCLVSFQKRGEDTKTPFYIREIFEGDTGFVARGYTPARTRWGTTTDISFDRLDLNWPDLGLINYSDYIVFGTQVPQRQWRRGLHHGNSSFTVVSWDIVRRYVEEFNPFSATAAHALYNPRYSSAGEALNEVLSGATTARAINKEVWVGIDSGYDTPVVGFNTDVIGIYQNGRFRLLEGMEPLRETIGEVLGDVA